MKISIFTYALSIVNFVLMIGTFYLVYKLFKYFIKK